MKNRPIMYNNIKMYLIILTYIFFVRTDFISAIIPKSYGNDYIGINGNANPCEIINNKHNDENTHAYNTYGDDLCNSGKNIFISCSVVNGKGYKPCSKINNNCSNNNYSNESWIGKLKYLSKHNYTFCENYNYRFILTGTDQLNNKIINYKKNTMIDPDLDVYIIIRFGMMAGIYCGLFLWIIFFN